MKRGKQAKEKRREAAEERQQSSKRRKGKGLRRLVKDGELSASEVLALEDAKLPGEPKLGSRITAWLERKARLE